MTDFFMLAVAVFLAVVLVRLLTAGWANDDMAQEAFEAVEQEDHA